MPNARGDWWKFSKDSKGKEAKKSGGRAAGILGLYVSLGMGSGQGGNTGETRSKGSKKRRTTGNSATKKPKRGD